MARTAMYRKCDSIRLKISPLTVYQASNYSQEVTTFSDLNVRKIPDPSLHALKRGTGGRSSFNGIVCTVFGATGFLGKYLLNRLGKIGTQIIVPYRGDLCDTIHLRPVADLGQLLFHPFNLRDEDSIRKAVVHSNVVINLIGRDWNTWNYKLADVHVIGCGRIAKICKEMGVEKLIHFSALNACENPKPIALSNGSEFLRTKWLGEKAVREEFPEAVIFRPADMWGEEDKFFTYYGGAMRNFYRTLYLWRRGEGVIKQAVDVTDVASAVVEAVKDPECVGKVYQAVGSKRFYLTDFVDWYYQDVLYKTKKEWHYKRWDARWNPLFLLYLTLIDKSICVAPSNSKMCWERFERSNMGFAYLSREIPATEFPKIPFIGCLLHERNIRAEFHVFWRMGLPKVVYSVSQEHTSDVLEPGCYTLEDLGVKLTPIEDVITALTYWLRAYSYYDLDPREYPDPPPLKSIYSYPQPQKQIPY